jgi:hypothetical protein
MYILRGQALPAYGHWADPETGIQYPENWLSLSTKADRAALGIQEVPDPVVRAAGGSLESQKQLKLAQIDSKTRTLLSNGFPFDERWFSMSTEAQTNWLTLMALVARGRVALDNLPTISTKDGGSYTFTSLEDLDKFLDIFSTFQSDRVSPLGLGRALKTRVIDAQTIAELNDIVDNR